MSAPTRRHQGHDLPHAGGGAHAGLDSVSIRKALSLSHPPHRRPKTAAGRLRAYAQAAKMTQAIYEEVRAREGQATARQRTRKMLMASWLGCQRSTRMLKQPSIGFRI